MRWPSTARNRLANGKRLASTQARRPLSGTLGAADAPPTVDRATAGRLTSSPPSRWLDEVERRGVTGRTEHVDLRLTRALSGRRRDGGASSPPPPRPTPPCPW